ncbi:MAG: hypothetical protein PT116_02670, partial [Aphanizomenon gracile PMC638.10]|nr:hypothetical protein [Aphanizomenon gracile PMC638.10]
NGIGNAGNIDITAKDSVKADVKIDGFSGIRSDVNRGAKGNAGNIDLKLNAGSLSLTNGGSITSLFYGETRRDGTSVKRGEWNGGKITINAGDINIKGRYSHNNSSFSSQINTGTLGIGNAGDIDIKASNITIDDQGFLSSLVYEGGEGKGGNIKIETSNLTLENGGTIITSTFGQGSAGYIKINARDSINISGYAKDENNKPIFYSSSPLIDDQGNAYQENKLASSRIESEVKTFASRGNGGFIDISTSKLTLEDGGVISTSTYGQGSAGFIQINETD